MSLCLFSSFATPKAGEEEEGEGGEGEQAAPPPFLLPTAGGSVASQFHKVEHRLVSLISSEAFVFLPDAAAGNFLHVNKTWSACSC